jgi:hypothetical protein
MNGRTCLKVSTPSPRMSLANRDYSAPVIAKEREGLAPAVRILGANACVSR